MNIGDYKVRHCIKAVAPSKEEKSIKKSHYSDVMSNTCPFQIKIRRGFSPSRSRNVSSDQEGV